MFQAWLHHHPPSHSIQRIRQKPCRRRDSLCSNPALPKCQVLTRVSRQFLLYGIEPTKVEPPVNYHSLKRCRKPSVNSSQSIFCSDCSQKVTDASKLTRFTSSNVGCEPGVCNVQRINYDQGCTTSCSPRNEVGWWTGKETSQLRIPTTQDASIKILWSNKLWSIPHYDIA